MYIKKAFSLAEAMITLLIVSIIMAVTAPILTKKKVRKDVNLLWHVDNSVHTAITPSPDRDIILGSYDDSVGKRGIVVRGKLYFKDTKGNIIGWIAEDGTNSFSKTEVFDMDAILQRQQKIDEAIEKLSLILQEQLQEQGSIKWNSQNNRQKTTSDEYNRNTNSENEAIQIQIDELIRMLNSQNSKG